MTTLLEHPRFARPTVPSGTRVVRVLAVREARWILRHPLFLFGIAGTLAMIWITTAWWQAPVLHRDDVRLAGTMLPLAAATMIVCNLAAFRARRHGTEEIENAAPTPQSRRAAAHLAAFLLPLLVAVLIAGGYVAFLYALGGISRPRLSELATGPAIVALAATAGIALARWIPSPIAVLLGLMAFAALQIRGGDGRIPGAAKWYVPFVDAGNESHVPELTIRPSGWHVLYLIGLACVFAAVATLRHGARRRRLALLVVPLTLAVFSTVMQSRPVAPDVLNERLSLVTDLTNQVCETRATVSYCVFPAYRDWIDRWDRTVRRVLAPVPPAHRPLITVRQVFNDDELYSLRVYQGASVPGHIGEDFESGYRPGEEAWRARGDVPMRTAWARGNDERGASIDLALAVSRKVISASEQVVKETRRYTVEDIERFRQQASSEGVEFIDEPPKVGDPYEVSSPCSTAGQAREAIGIWLAFQGVPGWEDWLRSTLPAHAGITFEELATGRGGDGWPLINALTWRGASFVWSSFEVPFSRGGIQTALAMAQRPRGDVVTLTANDWESWIRSTTTLSTLRHALGLSGESSDPAQPRLPLPLPTCP